MFLIASQGDLLDTVRGVSETFGFNLWAFVSQALSFSLVCGVLYKFAYRPILTILEERRSAIERSLQDAALVKLQLAEAEKKSREILLEASAQAQRLIDDAKLSASEFRERRLTEIAAMADSILQKARDESSRDYEKMLRVLRGELSRLVVETTSRVIGRVITEEDQVRLSESVARDVAA